MKHPHGWTVVVLATLTIGAACGDDDGERQESLGGSGDGAGGSSGNGAAAGTNPPGDAGATDRGGVSADGSMGGALSLGSAGEAMGGIGGHGGDAAQPERWLAFQLWSEDESTRPLFLTGVPRNADAVEVAPDVDFWQWAPDGKRLLYATPAAYGGPPNGAFSVAVSASGTLGIPERLHEPLGEGALALRVSISPDSETLALQLYEEDVSTWYVWPSAGGVGDWRLVSTSAAESAVPSEVRWMWSPDGARAALVQREDATRDSLLLVDAKTGTGTPRRFGGLRLLQWSADGSRVFVAARDPDTDEPALFAIDADGAADAVELSDRGVHSAFDASKFAVSSDGETVAFQAQVGGTGAGRLFIKQVTSAEPAVPTTGDNPSDIVWSESAQRFAYIATHLYVVPRQGGSAERVNPEGTIATCNVAPCLREAGEALLLMTSDANQDLLGNQLYDIDLSTPSPSARQLTAFAAETLIDFLAVSPDSSQVLLFTTEAAGKDGIYLVHRGAAPSVTRLFPTVGSSLHWPIGWSPDSRFLEVRADPDHDGYLDLFAVPSGRRGVALPAPLTPQGRKVTSVDVQWRPVASP